MEIDGEEFHIRVLPPQDTRAPSRHIPNLFSRPIVRTEKRPQSDQLQIYCPLCERDPRKETCLACGKKKYVALQSSFYKFVASILQYKLGRHSEETQASTNSEIVFDEHPRTYQSLTLQNFFMEEGEIIVKLSEIPYKNTLRSQVSVCCVHRNIQCNQCSVLPILGTKYMCKECPGYDLCENCFDVIDHQHQLVAVHTSNYSMRREKLKLHPHTHKQLADLGGGVMNLLNNTRNLF